MKNPLTPAHLPREMGAHHSAEMQLLFHELSVHCAFFYPRYFVFSLKSRCLSSQITASYCLLLGLCWFRYADRLNGARSWV